MSESRASPNVQIFKSGGQLTWSPPRLVRRAQIALNGIVGETKTASTSLLSVGLDIRISPL